MERRSVDPSLTTRASRRFSRTQLLLLASLLFAPWVARAELIQNGSFEVQAIPDGTLQATTPTNWNGGAALMNPNAAGGFAGNPFTWPQAADGQQYEDIGNESKYALSQLFTVLDADTYVLRWLDNTALNIAPGFQTAPYSVSILDASSSIVLSSTLDSWHSDGAWQAREFSQFLSVGAYTLTFTSLNSFNRTDTLIDGVSLAVAPSSVPEPSTALLLTLGAFALSLTSTRRRATTGKPCGQPDAPIRGFDLASISTTRR